MSDTFLSALVWLTVALLMVALNLWSETMLAKFLTVTVLGAAVLLFTMSLVGFVALPTWMLPPR